MNALCNSQREELERYLTLHGQQFKPGDRQRPLYSLSFCRGCGQEYLPVWAQLAGKHPQAFEPRDLSDRSNDDEEIQYGYLVPDPSGMFDAAESDSRYPEDWLEFRGDEARLKPHFRQYRPLQVRVDTTGGIAADGLPAWFIPGSFRFCLNPDCDAYFDGSVRSELTKLSGLSSEGRSSATTVLALSSLKHLIGTDLDERTKKLLAFTDNRQDVSLQDGHFCTQQTRRTGPQRALRASGWEIALRLITRSTDQRTAIAVLIPAIGLGHKGAIVSLSGGLSRSARPREPRMSEPLSPRQFGDPA